MSSIGGCSSVGRAPLCKAEVVGSIPISSTYAKLAKDSMISLQFLPGSSFSGWGISLFDIAGNNEERIRIQINLDNADVSKW